MTNKVHIIERKGLYSDIIITNSNCQLILKDINIAKIINREDDYVEIRLTRTCFTCIHQNFIGGILAKKSDVEYTYIDYPDCVYHEDNRFEMEV